MFATLYTAFIRRCWDDTLHPPNSHTYCCKDVLLSRELSLVPPRWLSSPVRATTCLLPLFWAASLDLPAVNTLHTLVLTGFHIKQTKYPLSLHAFSCAKPEKRLKFKHKAWAGAVLSHAGTKVFWNLERNLRGLQRVWGRPKA